MTIRNFDRLMTPRSIAVIGASPQPRSIGHVLVRNVVTGGFAGRIDLVNPRHATIDDRPCAPSVTALLEPPDLAVIATPPASIPGIVAELVAKGTRTAVIISAGLSADQRQQMLNAGRSACFRILGPNCLGLLRPSLGLNASFAHRNALAGRIAFLSQSGALVTAVIDWAADRGIGFSHIISLGDMADIDVGDCLDDLAADPSCDAVLMYIEAITNAPKFLSAARRAARVKPVVAIKAGRSPSAARAAFSHTGALAGSDAAYDAAFRRAGIVRVDDLDDLFNAAALLSATPRLVGERLAILTNGGGAGVLATDRLAACGGTLAKLTAQTRSALDTALPSTWSRDNPVDIIGDAGTVRYETALLALLGDTATDAVLVLNCPTALNSSTEIAAGVIATIDRAKAPKTVLANWLGADAATQARRLFSEKSIPTFETPAAAIDGFMHLVSHMRAQKSLMRTPPTPDDTRPFDRDAVDRVLGAASSAGQTMLPDHATKQVLAAYGIPVAATLAAATPSEVETLASVLLKTTTSVAVKILSPDITHKSDVGGVQLAIPTAVAAGAAAQEMHARIARSHPTARLNGFTVSPFIQKPRAHELILGIAEDATFGPLILFGAGGTSVEVARDTALALPPLDALLAHDLIDRTRIAKLLAGYRDRPAADVDAIAYALMRLSALAANHPQIRELDINPLLADADGIIALDARMRIADPVTDPRKPMAIRPYPAQWQRRATIAGIGHVHIRPIRPDDEALYARFFERVTPADRRLRLFTPAKSLDHGFLARLTQIDYAREIAFVALAEESGDLLGVVRFFAEPNLEEAEFAILVRSDLKGRGLGWRLMQLLLGYARAEGLLRLAGSVLEENTGMLQMCREFGFSTKSVRGDPGIVHVALDLTAPNTPVE